MADILALNAIKSLKKSVDGTKLCFERPTHATNVVQVTGGNTCCVCVPSTATKLVIEMWGQGGGGSGANCCQWGFYGGQGGDYGSKTFTLTPGGSGQTICACSCHNSNTCCCTAPAGEFSRVWNCTTGLQYCVAGGTAGVSCCMYCCGCSYNTQYAAAYTGALNVSSLSRDTNPTTSFATSTTTACGADFLFQKVTCACFDNYRRGSCGFSGAKLNGENRDYGIGGASYAGGGVQEKTCSETNAAAYCGACGNFPGGGGHGSGACGGANCYGSVGGNGLIIISWA